MRVLASRPRTLLLAAVVAVLAACSGQSLKDPDGDENRQKARPFKALEPTVDKLDANTGDLEDWRWFQPEKAGKQEIRISVGKWNESTISGFVTIFTEVGDRVLERPIAPGSGITIKEAFDVEAGIKYLVRFKAVSGKGEYAVEVGDPEDPCAACTDKQECVEGKCVEKACGGGCPEGQTCDRASDKCVKVKEKPENKCENVDCPKGEYCVRSTGRCVPAKKDDGPEPPKEDPAIECSIIDAREAGTGSILTLSCGDNKGVKKGSTGFVKGVKGANFTVSEVYPSRAKAVCKAPPSKLVGQSSVSIKK